MSANIIPAGRPRLVTAFGSAALCRAIVKNLHGIPADRCMVLTPTVARKDGLSRLLKNEGMGNVRVLTLSGHAAELAGLTGLAALSGARLWMLFYGAFMDPALNGQFETAARNNRAAAGIYGIINGLRASSVKSGDLEPLESKHPLAASFAALLDLYEKNMRSRNVVEHKAVLQTAARNMEKKTADLPGLYIIDSAHELRPDEFEFAVALAQDRAGCIFICDPSAPPPAGQTVVRDAASELARRFPKIVTESGAPSSGEELGRKILEGSLAPDDKIRVLLYSDIAQELRGVAHAARTLIQKEGISPRDMAFFVSGNNAHTRLLQYELERAGVLQEEEPAGHPAHTALKREARLVLALLAEPTKAGLRRKAVLSGMAADEQELDEKLAVLLDKKKSSSIEELFWEAVDRLLPDISGREKKALNTYREAAADFTSLAGSGAADSDLPVFISALDGYMYEADRERSGISSFFISPGRPPVREYSAVFLPLLNIPSEPAWQEIPGVRRFTEALEGILGKPVHLPAGSAIDRERWQFATAAAAGEKVVFSCHRQEGGRRVEPVPWLRDALENAPQKPQTAPVKVINVFPNPSNEIAAPAFLSASAINDYLACPYMFYLRRILRLDAGKSEQMSLGLLLHEALAEFHRPGQTEFSKERMRHVYVVIAAKTELVTEQLGRAWMLLENYVSERAFCGGETIATECPFELKFSGTTIFGKIDRIVPVPGGVKIIDYKTSGSGKEKKHKNAAVERLDDLQLPLYTLAAREMEHQVKAFSYVYLDYEKTCRPHEIMLEFGEESAKNVITEVELRESLQRIKNIIEEILAGPAEYGKGENAPCTARYRWCDYSTICPVAGD